MIFSGRTGISIAPQRTVVFGHEGEISECTGWRFLDSFYVRPSPLEKVKARMWEYGKEQCWFQSISQDRIGLARL